MDDIKFEWTVWGIRDGGIKKSLFTILIILLSLYGAYYIMGKTGVLVGVFIFLVSLNRYIFPFKYILKKDSIEIKGPYRSVYPYKRYKRMVVVEDGVFLATMKNPSRLDHFRGLFIPVPKHINKDEVVEWIKECME